MSDLKSIENNDKNICITSKAIIVFGYNNGSFNVKKVYYCIFENDKTKKIYSSAENNKNTDIMKKDNNLIIILFELFNKKYYFFKKNLLLKLLYFNKIYKKSYIKKEFDVVLIDTIIIMACSFQNEEFNVNTAFIYKKEYDENNMYDIMNIYDNDKNRTCLVPKEEYKINANIMNETNFTDKSSFYLPLMSCKDGKNYLILKNNVYIKISY
jgi:hypothetical protein